jgi:hypothetical protein
MVAYADVRQVMDSPFHDRFQQYQRNSSSSPDGLEARTGINIERDIDRVLVASTMVSDNTPVDTPPGVGAASSGFWGSASLLVARGRFDTVRIEGLMRQQGAEVEQYRGMRLISIKDDKNDTTVSFAEPGLVLFGSRDGVRGALDAKAGAAARITANGEFMTLVDGVNDGTAWSVMKFDSLHGNAAIPSGVMTQLPPINWLAASGRIDSGLHGLVRAEAQDEQGAQNLRDVVQGFLALARMQGAREPAYRGMLDSVALASEGKSVSLSFVVTPSALDVLTPSGGAGRRRLAPQR